MGKSAEVHRDWIQACVADLCAKPSKSVALAGSHLPKEVQVATFLINQELGAIGKTIHYLTTEDAPEGVSELRQKIVDEEIDKLVILGGNPIFLTDSFVDWESLRKTGKLKKVARIGHSIDESSEFSDLHIGQSHYLESWDLGGTWDQKAIVPVNPSSSLRYCFRSRVDPCPLGSAQSPHELVKVCTRTWTVQSLSMISFV